MAIETKAGTTRALTNSRIPAVGTAIKQVIFKPDISINLRIANLFSPNPTRSA
jgi:hypothetical protein